MFLYLIGFAVIFHLYVFWKLYGAFGLGRWCAAFLGIFVLFTGASFSRYFEVWNSGRLFEILFALTVTEYVVVGMLCAVLILTEIFKILLCLWDKVMKTRTESCVTPRRAAVFSLLFVFCAAVYGYYEAWNVRRVHLTLPVKLPPGVERLRVVQISDVHIGGVYPTRHLERVMEMVRAAEPDIFVVTGDLVDGNMAHRNREAELISNHGAKHGAFAIVGNHEYYAGFDQALEFIERCGLTLLYDQVTQAAGIAILGLDDLTTVWPVYLKMPDGFILLLRHRPHVLKTSRGKFDLQLSGHTHGGQIWPMGPLSQRLQGYTQGLSKDGESFVYISNGTGYWAAPLRLFAPPEVTVVDLVPLQKR